jgi:hypothetical protein
MWRLPLCLWLVCFVSALALPQATQRVESFPDGSVILTPAQLFSINNSLTMLERNFETQKKLSDSLRLELETTGASLETLKNLSIEQAGLINNLRLQWTLVSERLQESDQSWVWAMEDLTTMEASLAREQANSARLDRNARFWRTVAIVAGVLAIGTGVAAGMAIVW